VAEHHDGRLEIIRWTVARPDRDLPALVEVHAA
jgi:hypothetical protein